MLPLAALADERTWAIMEWAADPGNISYMEKIGVSPEGALAAYEYAENAPRQHQKNDDDARAAVCKDASESKPEALAAALDKMVEDVGAQRAAIAAGFYENLSEGDAEILRGLEEKVKVQIESAKPGDVIRKGDRSAKWVIDTFCKGEQP